MDQDLKRVFDSVEGLRSELREESQVQGLKRASVLGQLETLRKKVEHTTGAQKEITLRLCRNYGNSLLTRFAVLERVVEELVEEVRRLGRSEVTTPARLRLVLWLLVAAEPAPIP